MHIRENKDWLLWWGLYAPFYKDVATRSAFIFSLSWKSLSCCLWCLSCIVLLRLTVYPMVWTISKLNILNIDYLN